jgi:hypothetical protein
VGWSLLAHRLNGKLNWNRRAAGWARQGYRERGAGRPLRALASLAAAALLAPGVALRRSRALARTPCDLGDAAWRSPMTRAWRDFAGRHPDGFIGPRFLTTLEVPPGAQVCRIEARPVIRGLPLALDVSVAVDRRVLLRHRVADQQPFVLSVPLTGLAAGRHELEITTRPFLVPDEYLGDGDQRPLAFRLQEVRLAAEPEAALTGAPPPARPKGAA